VDLRRSRLINLADKKFIKAAPANDSLSYSIFVVFQSPEWIKMLSDFPRVTRESPVPEKFLHDVEYELQTFGPPLYFRSRRLPPERLRIARQEFNHMQEKGICRPSSSSWTSPLLLVAKKDGTFSPCGDYKRLNKVTRPYRYPLPHLHDFTTNLAGRE